MSLYDTYRLLISGYLGISELDEYKSKEYVLKNINDYLKNFVKTYNLNYNYHEVYNELEKKSLKEKLQDSLLVLNMLDEPYDLTILIRRKINELD